MTLTPAVEIAGLTKSYGDHPVLEAMLPAVRHPSNDLDSRWCVCSACASSKPTAKHHRSNT
jgi:hypothetical protein